MKFNFKNWMEMMGSVGSIVSCKDLNNPDFQVQGALSNLKCKKKKKKRIVESYSQDDSPLMRLAEKFKNPEEVKRILKYMFNCNGSNKIKEWESNIKNSQQLLEKIKSWQERGLINKDKIHQFEKKQFVTNWRLSQSKDSASWFNLLSPEQKSDIQNLRSSAKRGNCLKPPNWISNEELPFLWQQVTGSL